MIDVLVTPARHHGLGRAQVGVQAELLPQADIHRSEPAADRRRQRALERQPGSADAVDQGRGQRIAPFLDRCHAPWLTVPLERGAKGIEDADNGLRDLGADTVTRDQGCRNGTKRFCIRHVCFLNRGRCPFRHHIQAACL